MKLILGTALVFGGLGGTAVSFSSDILVLQSSLQVINGSELSVALGLFSILAFLGGINLLLASA